jgi:hypothetical protein
MYDSISTMKNPYGGLKSLLSTAIGIGTNGDGKHGVATPLATKSVYSFGAALAAAIAARSVCLA